MKSPSQRIRLLYRALLAAMMVTCLADGATERPPNIVYLLADDLGWKDVGFNGGNVPTPHLDQLARGGVQLTQHYVYTVCSATRASLLTGRYSTRFGFAGALNTRALPSETVTLPRALQAAGYETALSGKWHLGSKPEWGPQHYGFDHSYGALAGGVGPWDHLYKSGPYARTWHRNGRYVEEEGHVTDLLTREAVDWIEARGERPFFLYVPFTAPHVPIREPQEYVRRVPAGITEPSRREYAAALMHLDDAIGRILAALRRTGKWENTIVVFTSDNGATPNNPNFQRGYQPDNYTDGPAGGDNRPFRGSKGNVYEGGIRVPTVVSWPGRLQPGKVAEPIHVIDWMPTFCALAGYQPQQDLRWDGQNVWPVLTGSRSPAPRPLYWASPALAERAVRLGDWKLIVNHARGPLRQSPARSESVELYNLATDPHETADLAARRPEKVNELRTVLAQVSKADGDATVAD
jgi:arylsulfatase A-like enzyme